MKLNALAKQIPGYASVFGNGDEEILSLCSDSRHAQPGSLFFCIPGMHVDAHDLAPQALQNGAVALVVERKLDLDCPQVLAKDVREAMSYMAQAFYGNPARSLKLVGITGTKGKTTTSFLVKSILEQAGHKAGLIGTVCSMIGDEVIPSRLTTPDPIEVQELLRRMADGGAEYVVMEISAHALAMHRLIGMHFAVAAFSNFSQDHLDYFGDMDTYFSAKMRLFEEDMSDAIVFNCDDERVAEAFDRLGREALRVGIRECSYVYLNDIEVGERGLTFLLTHHKRFRIAVSLKLSGIFNAYNALLAAGIAIVLGIGPEAIQNGLEDVRAVPGRIELLETETPYRVILDYAHSPDSLENILKAVRETARGRLIALFGCGGDRDHGKRPLMGEIAGELADLCVLTSDNPRNEDPFAILNAIEEGIRHTGCEYTVIENRREAIRHALLIAEPGDVVVLAGKGHETYQEIRGVKHPFDEKIVVKELLREMRGNGK